MWSMHDHWRRIWSECGSRRTAPLLLVGLLFLLLLSSNSNRRYIHLPPMKITMTRTTRYPSPVGMVTVRPVVDNPLLNRMRNTSGVSLQRSARQQASFLAKKDTLTHVFPELRRYSLFLSLWAANQVTEEYVYLHIFKNGGTTIATQTSRGHTRIMDPTVQERKWFTLVRDPMDHFLSGWAEVGNAKRQASLKRQHLNIQKPFELSEPVPDGLLAPYDKRIRAWLRIVQRAMRLEDNRWHPEVHSAPQVNFLLNPQGRTIWESLELIGDLSELPAVLDMVGFSFNASKESGRNASANLYLQTYYPRRLDLISNETMRMLCDFLAIDYYLLDYPLPEACQDMPVTGYTVWRPLKYPPKPKRAT